MRTTLFVACFSLIAAALAACDGGSESEAGGSGGTTSSTTSSGGGCDDPNEPNETLNAPAFFNDASQGLSICDTTGSTITAVLADAADVDWFRGYSLMASGCTPAPTATISGLADAANLCLYLQDDATPTVKSCPAGTTMAPPENGYTGCCAKATAGAGATITLTDITDLGAASANPQFAVKLSGSVKACNAYSLTVHF